MIPVHRVHVLLGIVLPLLIARASQAETCPLIANGTETRAKYDAQRRLEFIQEALHDDGRRERLWRTAWLIALPIIDAGEISGAISGTFAPTPPGPTNNFRAFLLGVLRNGQYGLYAGSITAAGGIGSVLLRTADTAFDDRRLDAIVANRTLTNPCALLAEAERLLMRDARDERLAHGPIPHIVSAAVSISTLLVIGLVFHRWVSAATNAGLGLAGGELLIATEPRDADAALTSYQLGDLAPRQLPVVTLEFSGAALALRF